MRIKRLSQWFRKRSTWGCVRDANLPRGINCHRKQTKFTIPSQLPQNCGAVAFESHGCNPWSAKYRSKRESPSDGIPRAHRAELQRLTNHLMCFEQFQNGADAFLDAQVARVQEQVWFLGRFVDGRDAWEIR
jgi:hypothetical protein